MIHSSTTFFQDMEKRGVDTNGNLIHRLKKPSVEDHNHLYEAELDDEVDGDGLNDESLPIPKVPYVH